MSVGRPAKTERTVFGEKLAQARKSKGLSQEEVAEKLGITQNAYAKWERYPVALRPEQIKQIAAILGVTPNDLIPPDSNDKP